MGVTRQATIQNAPVYVLDAEVPLENVKELWREFSYDRSYSRSESANEARLQIKHWATELNIDAFMASPVGVRTADLIQRYFPNEGQKPIRAYCNVASYGDVLSVHHDCSVGENDVTVLWFVCDEWEHDWRGELLIFDEQYDAQLAITPKPGRVCLFRGWLPHTGTPPSRLCYKPRLTLVCKFSPTDDRIADADSGPGKFRSVSGLVKYVAQRLEGTPTSHMKPATFKIVVKGEGGGLWFADVTKDGIKITQEDRDADLTITTDAETFLDAVNGKINVKKAFIFGKIKARGNLELALRLRDLRDLVTAIK